MADMKHWDYRRYNYGSMKRLLEDFPKYSSVEFKGIEKGRMEAIDALVYLMGRYYQNKGYVLTKELVITADYTPKRMPKRYDYGIAYSMVFTLNLNGNPFQTVQDVKYDGKAYSVSTKDVTFVFDVKEEYLNQEYIGGRWTHDNREQVERDLENDEEEMPQPEEQGLPSLREERNPRVSRVARL